RSPLAEERMGLVVRHPHRRTGPRAQSRVRGSDAAAPSSPVRKGAEHRWYALPDRIAEVLEGRLDPTLWAGLAVVRETEALLRSQGHSGAGPGYFLKHQRCGLPAGQGGAARARAVRDSKAALSPHSRPTTHTRAPLKFVR